MKHTIKEFVECISELTDKKKITSAYSNLDHVLRDMSPEDRVNAFRVCPFDGIINVKKADKVYIAALAEYIFNTENEKPPEWVWDKDCYFEEETFPDSLRVLENMQADVDKIRDIMRKKALPEFKRRNYIITEVLNSY